ncbi:Ldh family oxidoreductase [Stakelama pacifica]|uniref:LDH2 family malate/lactate/ureidoglycolate dehydrogenase n=1 Tax=Stakelama pacifica TaxID=517720 RepID=A0A4R6FDB1_9SPHN|nr:Ldh family oxidoreductase [Stakelama pacifica]TDN78255.1 LDH2 family malate/lactate/ureidoglycolate dehydrogenase [Stakelama pacifica]GGO99791.1 delta(1)-pyrroline-2-carboxylate/Delta(1)-piperideine-2-carboxylate reductase [Stakelama pacifica]
MLESVPITLDEARALARRVLLRHGLAEDHVASVIETIVAGERDGCTSHGLYRLIVCAHTLSTGAVAKAAKPEIIDLAPSIVHVDADGGFAPLAHSMGLPLLIAKARAQGVAAMVLTRCVHFAALWPDIEPLADEGLVALACTPSHAWVAPHGGTLPMFGTNPLAFAWPRQGRPSLVFDFATSAVARGEIELHRRQGRPLAKGWAIDSQGAPTTDPEAALAGAMLTFGGHKGSALALMIELIAGPLIGDLTSRESLIHDDGRKASPFGGVLILAMDPSAFLGDTAAFHLSRAEALFQSLVEQGARLPGDRRLAARRAHDTAPLSIDRALYDDLIALSGDP